MEQKFNDTTRYLNEYPDFINKVRKSVDIFSNTNQGPMIDLKDVKTGFERKVYYAKIEQKYFLIDCLSGENIGNRVNVYSGEDLFSNRRPKEVSDIVAILTESPGEPVLPLPLILSFNEDFKEHYTEKMICEVLTFPRNPYVDIETLKEANPMLAKYEFKGGKANYPVLMNHYTSVVENYFHNSLWISNTADLNDFTTAVDKISDKNTSFKMLYLDNSNFKESNFGEDFILKCNKHIAGYYDVLVDDLLEDLEQSFKALTKVQEQALDNTLWLENDGNRLICVKDTSVLIVDKGKEKGDYEVYYREFDSVAKFREDIASGKINKLAENVISFKGYIAEQIQECFFEVIELTIKEACEKLDDMSLVINKERNHKLN